ncbi:PH domain-containing protein [Tomitella fengzijianii]|uniref:PH domain-containing protein n=1 Tax=Tomitella fengzijianii TaxID=2597660 RepID=A0A516X182_9ACTN|nr:PH domain-containing protein [Tomitella fengzijianii]QDQ96777.1 PH domain-containing protein [Tomitella fengzijianii]
MAYPESVLEPGETVLWHRNPHWKSVLPAALLLPVLTGVAGICGGLIERHAGPGVSAVLYSVLAVAWCAAVWWRCVLPWLRWRSTHFVVTDRRVMVRQGVFSRSGFELELERVSDVRYRRSFSERLLGAGTLVLRSSSAEPLEFAGMPGARRVQRLIREEAGWS